jgi:hypothetical protein
VSLHLADDGYGGDIIEIEGEAALDSDAPPSKDHPAYSAKYVELLARYGWTPEYYGAEYPHPYRIVPAIVRSY